MTDYTILQYFDSPEPMARLDAAFKKHGLCASRDKALEAAINKCLHDAICGGLSNPFFTIESTVDGEPYFNWVRLGISEWDDILGTLSAKMHRRF